MLNENFNLTQYIGKYISLTCKKLMYYCGKVKEIKISKLFITDIYLTIDFAEEISPGVYPHFAFNDENEIDRVLATAADTKEESNQLALLVYNLS